MKYTSVPLYQAIIQNLPVGKKIASKTLGILSGGKIKAVVNRAKMRLDLQEGIQLNMFLGSYEPIQTEWFKQCINPGDTFIDVGANFGHYTTLGAVLVGSTGKVFAFEPSPVASKVLEEAIRDSNIQNIVLKKAAVGKTEGVVDLLLPTTRHLHSPSIMKSDPDFIPFQVPVITLDSFEPLNEVEQIKLVKIDVEGYEPDVLDGMENLIKDKRIKNVFCEFNSWWLEQNSTTPKQLLERFLDYGYMINRQTKLLTGLAGHKGAVFELQDIWFKLPDQ